MKLIVSDFCPFCHACRLVLTAKNLPHEIVALDLSEKTNFKHLLSPYLHVPVLFHKDQKIYENTVINEYLEDAFPEICVLPNDPSARADVRFWVSFVHARLVPAYFDLMNMQDPNHWPKLIDRLERWLFFLEENAFEQKFVSGDRIGLADYTLYPWFERFVSAARYRCARIPTKCVKLRRWLDEMQGSEAVKACAKTENDYISFFDQYWSPLPTG